MNLTYFRGANVDEITGRKPNAGILTLLPPCMCLFITLFSKVEEVYIKRTPLTRGTDFGELAICWISIILSFMHIFPACFIDLFYC